MVRSIWASGIQILDMCCNRYCVKISSFWNGFAEIWNGKIHEIQFDFFFWCLYLNFDFHEKPRVVMPIYNVGWYMFQIFLLLWHETIWPNLIFLSRLWFHVIESHGCNIPITVYIGIYFSILTFKQTHTVRNTYRQSCCVCT